MRTDFVLSAEIIAITLGTVEGQDLMRQALVLSAISMVMTIGVYGLVAGIVKLDDAGLYLTQRAGAFPRNIGRAILWFAPFLMKTLSVVGTAAMFLVGGHIVVHGIPPLSHAIEHTIASFGSLFSAIALPLSEGIIGLIAGALVLLLVMGIKKLRGKPATPAH